MAGGLPGQGPSVLDQGRSSLGVVNQHRVERMRPNGDAGVIDRRKILASISSGFGLWFAVESSGYHAHQTVEATE